MKKKLSRVMSTRTPARPPHRWRGGALRILSMISSMALLDGVVRVHLDLELDELRRGRPLLLRPLEIHPGEEVGDRLGGEILHRSLSAHQLHPGVGSLASLLDQPPHPPGGPDDALQPAHELGHVLVTG